MVTKEEIAELVKQFIPKCPICGEDCNYDVTGFGHDYFQCTSCGAKWQSTDLSKRKIKDITFKQAMLWEPATDGRGKELKLKKKPIELWKNLSQDEIKKVETVKKTTNIQSFFKSKMSVSQVEDSILKSLKEIETWDYGSTRYGKLGFLLDNSSHAEQANVRLLRSIFEQNKILILQNELLRRELQKLGSLKNSEES